MTIFPNPAPGEYLSAGASVAGPGGNLEGYKTAEARFGPVSAAAADQPQIRYSGAGYYEIQMPGGAWDRLIHYKGLGNPDPGNNYFQPAGVAQNEGYLFTYQARDKGYSYSEMGDWGSSAAQRYGFVAFGVPTPDGAVPVTGSATYSGRLIGSSDIMEADSFYGGYVPARVEGDVTLSFNFAGGSLNGSASFYLPDGMQPLKIGTYAFSQPVFSVGSTSYSGRFDTSAAGENFFRGRFTGPGAQETIGSWALPFVFTSGGETLKADGQAHQAFGAWIAKKSN